MILDLVFFLDLDDSLSFLMFFFFKKFIYDIYRKPFPNFAVHTCFPSFLLFKLFFLTAIEHDLDYSFANFSQINII